MSDVTVPDTEAILRLFSDGCSHSQKQIEHAIRKPPQTTNKVLNELLARRLIAQQGSACGTTYTLTLQGRAIVVFDSIAYLRRLPDARAMFTSIQPIFFDLFEGSMSQATQAQFGTTCDKYTILMTDTEPIAARKQLRRFMIEFIWKSSALEGNTYTFDETKRLLIGGIPASDHLPAETIMILNHKKAFDYISHNNSNYQQLTRQVDAPGVRVA